MPHIHPFQAFVFNEPYRKKIRALVCPPYDVVDAAQRAALLKQDPLNFIRVEMPVGDPRRRYADAARLWTQWRRRGVLAQHAAPAFYVYEARFSSPLNGRTLVRRGVFASLAAEPWGRDGVFPHEKTLPTHKADRFELFKALRVQTSPIQLMVRDRSGTINALINRHARGRPWLQFRDKAGVTHRMWVWPEGKDAAALQRAFLSTPCAIADGHHRYETSLAYGRWARSTEGKNAGPEAGRVMAYFSSSDDKGLEVLPTHRSVPWEKRRFVNLEAWGNLTPVKGWTDLIPLVEGKKGAARDVGVYRDGRWFVYRFSKVPKELRGKPHASLAVACLHAGPLKGLGKEDFFFTRNPRAAAAMAKKTRGWAFFLAPNTVKEVLDVATARYVMPPKSTYFFPKIPSGMVCKSL